MKKQLLMLILAGHVLVAQAGEPVAHHRGHAKHSHAAHTKTHVKHTHAVHAKQLHAAHVKQTHQVHARAEQERFAKVSYRHEATPQLRSSIALIYDEDLQSPLYTKNPDAVAPIASITKLMTAMVVLDSHPDLNEELSVDVADMDSLKGTHSRLGVGTTFTRSEMLKLALMSSENRAAAALARNYPGSTHAAVAAMNAKARELGMTNTTFRDPTGLNSENVSTARDLVKMVAAARHYALIREYTTTATHLVEGARGRELRFNNTNPLVKSDSWDIGLSKTGYISEAGRCLVMQARIDQRPVIIVLLDSVGKSTRVGDANRVKKWIEAVGPSETRRF
ncbi:MAG: D-alanyl-D-alanine endopeptidase [Gallionella sp.]|nr:D-alanyl-D-alanine endopeptidase [Gallionella sp.]MDD4947866.1 D-alanyl-D-alanine endopeptidase [Gallionella sp.]